MDLIARLPLELREQIACLNKAGRPIRRKKISKTSQIEAIARVSSLDALGVLLLLAMELKPVMNTASNAAFLRHYELYKDIVWASDFLIARLAIFSPFQHFASEFRTFIFGVVFRCSFMLEIEKHIGDDSVLPNELSGSEQNFLSVTRIGYTSNADAYGALGDFIVDLDDQLFETSVLISYQLKDGNINDFFKILDVTDKKKYFDDLKRQINLYFEVVVYAIEPSNPNNRVKLEFSKLEKVILSGLINAQRGLDDETHSERDVLGRSLGKIFNSASGAGAPEEFKAKSDEVKKVVEDLQTKVDTDFQEKVKLRLPKFSGAF